MGTLIKSFLPNTLALRLFLLASLAAILGVAIVAFVISAEYRRTSEDRLNDILTANIFNLMGNMELDGSGNLTGQPDLGDSRYRLLDSGWYWSVQKVGEPTARVSSLSMAGQQIEIPDKLPFDETFQRQFVMADQQGQMLQGLEAQVFLGEGNDLFSFRITANQSALNEEIAGFTQRIAVILSVLAFSIIFATYWIVKLGLKPISRATQILGDVRTGDAKRIDGDYPDEIQPLIDETNALISSNELIVERARTQVGNLAHSLKTPLAVMQNEISGLPTKKRALFSEQTDAMRKQVQFYLDRARISARSTTSIASTPIVPGIEKLASVVSKLNPATDVSVDLENISEVCFSGEEPDLQEIFGNLLENAAKYARSCMQISASHSGEMVTIHVEDDGPGMSAEEIRKASKRGGRVDEGKTGWGLGLSIVGDMVDEYDGTLELSRSELGGLKASVSLPAHKK